MKKGMLIQDKDKKLIFNFLLLFALISLMVIHTSYAKGTEQDGFKEVWATVVTYMQGSLGRILVGLIVVVGVAAAVVRQSLMVFAVAVGAAIGLYYSPDIIEGMMSSTQIPAVLPGILPDADKVLLFKPL